jgi:hypothetical protein
MQATHTRLDHVLLTLGNLFCIYSNPELDTEVHTVIHASLERRWAKADQDVFVMAVFLNPYVCKGTSVHLLTLPPLLPPTPVPTPRVDDYHHQGLTTSISINRRPRHIKVVDSHLLPPLAPQLHRTSIGYMGTCPRDTTAPSMSHGLMVEAWYCIGHYIYVLGPSQGSSEHSLWIPPN